MNTPHVAIAILNYNGKKHLETYLPSVMASTYGNQSIWVIDNQSTDNSLTFLAANYPQIRIIQNPGNMGFAAGYNHGLQQIEADYYILLNSDVEVVPDFIAGIINKMELDQNIAFAQPKLRWLRNRALFEYAGAAGGMIDSWGYPFCRGRVLENLEKDQGQYNDDAAVFWASGACMFARASVYKQLGGMYEFLYMQNEEIDMCWRAQNLGYTILASSAATVFHLGGGSLEWENPRKTFFTFRNNMIMNMRNMPVSRLIWLMPWRSALDILAGIRYMWGGKRRIGLAVVKGVFAYWQWLFIGGKTKSLSQTKQAKWPERKGFIILKGVFKGSIVWNYFTTKKRTYNELLK